jgi:regulation of enolase protein 1 (concanavalin A-like superfamily)
VKEARSGEAATGTREEARSAEGATGMKNSDPTAAEARWRNPPPFVERCGDTLVVRTGEKTDFWNRTFYGFKHGSGHLLAHPVHGDFSAVAAFAADYCNLYDQAGVMIFVDDRTWLKAGTEFTDGALHFSVVATREDQSDWSMMPLAGAASGETVTMRVTRHGEAIRVELRVGTDWQLARLAFLPMPDRVEVGPMCCSPTGAGLEVRFTRFEIGPPIPRELHAAK